MKSYLTEHLVEEIFSNIRINSSNRATRTFFPRAKDIIKKRKIIRDRVYTQKSILTEYKQKKLD